MSRFSLALFTIFLISILIGCSGSNSPTAPDYPDSDLSRNSNGLVTGSATLTYAAGVSEGTPLSSGYGRDNINNHNVLGVQRVRVYEGGYVEFLPLRSEQVHIDITLFMLTTPGAFSITLDPPPSGNTFHFKITFTNPIGISVWDLTTIIRFSGDIKFLNPDSYTFILSEPGDLTPNPFKAWATGVGNHEFAGLSAHSETISFELGSMTKFAEMDFLFQCSWPENQEEPYEIWDLNASDVFQNNGLNTVDLSCKVGDWQDNIDSVLIDLSPIGGSADSPMSPLGDDLYGYYGVSYGQSGQGVGDHKLKITATSNGVSTFNYLPITVVEAVPVKQGSFEIQYQNLPLEPPNGPTDGMDIAVMGAGDGTFISMVFGGDDTYHFWRNGYQEGTVGLYNDADGSPITPFSMPNFRFDFGDTSIPDSSGSSIHSLSWGESNTSEEIIDPATTPNVIARQRITLWLLSESGVKLTANVLVNIQSEGPPKIFNFIVRPLDFASGFNKDGLLYTTMVFDSGDDSMFPVVDIIGLKPPLDFQGNPGMIVDGYEVVIGEGSGPGVVNRDALVGIDIDDMGVMPISGGYAGHAWAAVVEGGAENTLEIIDADIDLYTNVITTVVLPSAPLDVEILPLKNAGESFNIISVLCEDNFIRLYGYDGALLDTIGGPPYMIGNALRLDIDDTNFAIHVLHQGAASPLVTVYRWDP
jgi:hypothetical protein